MGPQFHFFPHAYLISPAPLIEKATRSPFNISDIMVVNQVVLQFWDLYLLCSVPFIFVCILPQCMVLVITALEYVLMLERMSEPSLSFSSKFSWLSQVLSIFILTLESDCQSLQEVGPLAYWFGLHEAINQNGYNWYLNNPETWHISL